MPRIPMSDMEFARFLASDQGRLLAVEPLLREVAAEVARGRAMEDASVAAGADPAEVRASWDRERDSIAGDVRARMAARGWHWEKDPKNGRGSFTRDGHRMTWDGAISWLAEDLAPDPGAAPSTSA